MIKTAILGVVITAAAAAVILSGCGGGRSAPVPGYDGKLIPPPSFGDINQIAEGKELMCSVESREEAEKIGQRWRDGLAEMNRAADNLPCVIACGFAFGEKEDDLEDILKLADLRMYEDKKAIKERNREWS